MDRPSGTKGTTEVEQVEVETQVEPKRPDDTKGPLAKGGAMVMSGPREAMVLED